MEVSSWENHLFLWAIYTMAMLVITRWYMTCQRPKRWSSRPKARQPESPCEDVSHFTKRRPLPPALMKPRPPAGRGKWATSKSTTDIFPIKKYDVQIPFGGYTGYTLFSDGPIFVPTFRMQQYQCDVHIKCNGMIHDISIVWWSYNRVTCLKCLDSVRLKIEVGMQHHLPSGYLT